MARLARVRVLAQYESDHSALRRADALITREQTRHRGALALAWPALNDPKARPAEDDDPELRPRDEDDDQEFAP
jgi:hypothetical protein